MNMKQFADWLSEKLYLGGRIRVEEMDDISFALEVVLSHIISFGTILLIGVIFDKSIETLIFVFMFGLFRTLNNRYHAETFLQCFLLTVGSLLVSLFISEIILSQFQTQFIILLSILNIILVVFSNSAYKHTISMEYIVLMIALNVVVVACIAIIDKRLLIYIETVALILIISTVFSKQNE